MSATPLAAAFALGALAIRGAAPPDAAAILRHAEEVRSPAFDYALDIALDHHAPQTEWKRRAARYSMVAHGKEQSLVLMREPAALYPGALLIASGRFWMLAPHSSVPLELSPRQALDGDVANGDLARGDLQRDYAPRLAGTEELRGEACWQLELLRLRQGALYPRITCWIARKRFLPRRFDYYGQSGELLKVAWFEDYREGPLGLRTTRIVVENRVRPGETTTMTFENLRRFDASKLLFTPEGLIAFRDAARGRLSAAGSQATLEELSALVGTAAR